MFGHEKTPHIAHDHQNVLIDGIDVKQVVLHLPDDTAKRPQVAPEHAGAVHQPQGMNDALRRLQDAHELLPAARIVAEGAVHPVARQVDGA
jgi:hypothetical protein